MNDSMAATETSVGGRVIVFAQSIFLQSVALCVNSVWGLDCKFRLEAVELHHVSTVYTREVCIYMMFVFKRWRVLAHLSSNQQPSLYGNNPVCPHTHTHTGYKPAYNNRNCDWSVLPQSSSHKVPLTIWALLERQTQLVLQAKRVPSAGMFSWRCASCIVLHDGWSKFWVHIYNNVPAAQQQVDVNFLF